MPRVTSDNVATYLGLNHNDLAVMRLYAMLSGVVPGANQIITNSGRSDPECLLVDQT